MRIPFPKVSPGLYQNLAAIKTQLDSGSLGRPLAELVWTRVAEMNGCQTCIAIHGKGLLDAGDTQERLDALPHWRDSALFGDREKSALAYTEALTNVQTAGAPDSVYQPLKAHFDDKAIVELTFAIALLNAFTRISIGMAA
jgi:AhpD family alkylhydroperoxidase